MSLILLLESFPFLNPQLLLAWASTKRGLLLLLGSGPSQPKRSEASLVLERLLFDASRAEAMPPNANGDAKGPLTTNASTRNTKATDTDAKIALDKPTFCGTLTTARERRESSREAFESRGISSSQGYIRGRFAVRLMRVGRAEGTVLYAWMVWAYVKVIITLSGTANDYISKSPQPLFPAPTRTQADWDAYDAQREVDRRE
ncbi:hypothetical protein C8R45DRAFT_1173360 [Mycena sanguinolenta]|nr:hypothetical protein C8R45DRAFT_1173360 [Mycena sanguinolenta]